MTCTFPCDDDCDVTCHQAHQPAHKRYIEACGCATLPNWLAGLIAQELYSCEPLTLPPGVKDFASTAYGTHPLRLVFKATLADGTVLTSVRVIE